MRSLRLLAALVLTATATLTAASADAAPGDGTLTVTLVDEHGDPMPGMIYVVTDGGLGMSMQATASATWSLPPQAYAVVAITPWGGIQCAGVEECDYYSVTGGAAPPNGDVVVTAGQDSPVTITGESPVALHAPARVGVPLSVHYSEGLAEMLDYLGGAGGLGWRPSVTWMRDGAPIAGAEGDTYTPVAADGGTKLSATLEYTGTALNQFQVITGGPVTPRTTNAVTVGKVPTKAFAILSNPQVKAGSHGKVRVEVTAKNQVVTGKVTVTVGDWSATRALRNGSVRVLLPALGPGKYKVGARYLGTSGYQASTAQKRTLTVT